MDGKKSLEKIAPEKDHCSEARVTKEKRGMQKKKARNKIGSKARMGTPLIQLL